MQLSDLVRVLVLLGDAIAGTHAERLCLISLHADGDESMSNLALRIGMSRGAITTIVDRLETQGCAERFLSPQDRRIISVRATKHGHKQVLDALAKLAREQKAA